jgi:hypothetical protein
VVLDVKAMGGYCAGALNADGTEMAGTMTQGPVTLPPVFGSGNGEVEWVASVGWVG